ncbi:hypothetical protein D2T29_19820 [Sinirhodobacter populi]|uniref:Uncharacterized protein n=1 Tax=Paenirhodobacter populi TaxID=2306993 RepID=A0A443K240_9RHOB|nr:hypothetical protein [Sinirhodobacter populi]RWR26826.1 hypothetical protein D2T29_19820 [Sinirhodobacter populi]
MTIEFFLMLLGRAGFVMGIAWLLQISVMAAAFMVSRGVTASAWPAIFCGGGAALAWITACAFYFGAIS